MESFVQSQPGNDIILYNHQQQKYFHLLKPMQCKLLSLLALYFLIAINNLQVLDLTILVRGYFSGFYFRDISSQIWKKGIKFHDFAFSTSFWFSNSLNLLKISRWNKKCVKSLQINVIL